MEKKCPILRGMRVSLFLCLVLLVVACNGPTEPRAFTLGPGCWHSVTAGGVVTIKAHYPDCTAQNLDSLRAAGWTIQWDTTWAK